MKRGWVWIIFGIVLLVIPCVFCVFRQTPEDYWEENPAWSPDGEHIAFACYFGTPDLEGYYSDEGYEICISDSQGEGYLRLTNNDYFDNYPIWSPDGQSLAYVSRKGVMLLASLDESDPVSLTKDGEHLDWSLAWSPDGRFIAYTKNGDLYIVNVENGQSRLLSEGDNAQPDWSPDGQRIAFTAFSQNGPDDIYVVNVDRSNEIRLTYSVDKYNRSSSPHWSPDGRYIAFLSLKDNSAEPNDGYFALDLIEPDGNNRIELSASYHDYITWSPDGKTIIATSNDSPSIFIIDISTGNKTLLATIPNKSGPMSLSPDHQSVAVARYNPSRPIGGTPSERIWIMSLNGSKRFQLTQK